MQYFPMFMNLRNQPCLVIGGGEIARRKIHLLQQAGARITLVSPELISELAEQVRVGTLGHIAAEFNAAHLTDYRLVIAATDQRLVNEAVAAAANARHIPVNVVDQPDLCSFIMPAIVDRSPIIIAISSGGGVPVLARLLRAKLETLIPSTYGDLAALATRFRERVKTKFNHVTTRRIFWEEVLQGEVAEKAFAGKLEAAEAALERALEAADGSNPAQGAVYLVGSGPGNPDLLTFRALRLMQQADVVLYDNLVAPAIVDLCRRDAERIYVGKQKDKHTLPQQEINQQLVSLAKQGLRVLRLKGGDPFIFGRGGEEIETLAENGIPFEIVPGITSASGASTYAGIPLTHRDHAQSVTFVTGHRREGADSLAGLDWLALSRPQQTVVIYMGIGECREICAELIQHGRAPHTPAAVIERATTAQQRTFVSTLENLADTIVQHQVRSPALLIIGEVVQLHEKLNWRQENKHAEDAS